MTEHEAVIFDLDGTLTDTETLWDEVRRGLAAQDGVAWPPDATTAQMGMSTQEWSAYLVAVVGLHGTAQEVAQRTITTLESRYRTELPVLPGAVAAVRRLAARWPLGVASSSPRVLIDTALHVLGIADLIAVVRSTEEGTGRGKPAPDAFLWAAAQLEAKPENVAVVEDSSNGIRAGHSAGMKVVAIPPAFHPPPEDVLALADIVLTSLDELTVDVVGELLSRRS